MESNDIRPHLDAAYQALSRIPVSGDAVELMAKARQELRTAYALVQTANSKEAEPDNG